MAIVGLAGLATVGGGAAGIGPLARPLPPGTVYVAISRNDDETDAREIEVIDLAGGERRLFAVDRRITAMALSADRRSLYVAVDGPRIMLLDARTGSVFGRIDLDGARVSALVIGSDDRLYATTVSALSVTIVPIDADAKRAGRALEIGGTGLVGGRPAVLPGALLVPVAEPRLLQLVRVTLATLTVAGRTEITRAGGLPGAPAALSLGSDGTTAVVTPDAAGPRGARLLVFTDPEARREKTLSFGNFGFDSPRGILDIQAQAAASADGTAIQACVGNSRAARRYSVTVSDLAAVEVGTDCGQMVHGDADTVLIATRGSPRLIVIDEHTGTVRRTLALAGVPTQLAR
ncbi:MAG TPA: hypothetical protein VM070_04305 [Candidatus Saccharimonadales bacterium]|nr:hypothetical protein [Candidatus Saccharimonadales bacterium]